MVLVPFAVAIGLFIGLLRRGKLENLLGLKPSLWALTGGGVVMLLIGEYGTLDRAPATALFIVGSVTLIFCLAKNTRFTGAITIEVGLAANLLALVANGHVPVRLDALTKSGEVTDPSRAEASLTGLRELENSETRLSFLGEIVPVEVLEAAVSFGDLILTAGVAVFSMHILLARRRRGIDVEDLLGPATLVTHEPELDLRTPIESDAPIDLRPAAPKLVPAASDKARVFGPDESDFQPPNL
jgi:hypothetical protein